MELQEQMTMIVAALLANPNCGVVTAEDLAKVSAAVCDEINAYEWVEESNPAERSNFDPANLPLRGGGVDNPNEAPTE